MSELWDNPLFPMDERLEMAQGGVVFRDKIIENLREKLDRANWVSVDDALPLPETDVLVHCEFGAAKYFDIAGIFNDDWCSQVTGYECKHRVTHWMPLPKGPK
jgi:hypothetical protein